MGGGGRSQGRSPPGVLGSRERAESAALLVASSFIRAADALLARAPGTVGKPVALAQSPGGAILDGAGGWCPLPLSCPSGHSCHEPLQCPPLWGSGVRRPGGLVVAATGEPRIPEHQGKVAHRAREVFANTAFLAGSRAVRFVRQNDRKNWCFL